MPIGDQKKHEATLPVGEKVPRGEAGCQVGSGTMEKNRPLTRGLCRMNPAQGGGMWEPGHILLCVWEGRGVKGQGLGTEGPGANSLLILASWRVQVMFNKKKTTTTKNPLKTSPFHTKFKKRIRRGLSICSPCDLG